MTERRRSPWRFGVPLVCLLAGLLLAATHGVSGGAEIRRSDAPRLVDLVREAQSSVSRLSSLREARSIKIDSTHGRSSNTALAAMLKRAAELAGEADMDPVHGPGLVVTLNDAQRDANGRFPRDASPDDLVVHQQDIEAVLNAMWSPYTITAIGNPAAMQAALAAAPLVTLYKQYVVRFGLGYHEEVKPDVQIVGHSAPVRMHFAQPAGPVGY